MESGSSWSPTVRDSCPTQSFVDFVASSRHLQCSNLGPALFQPFPRLFRGFKHICFLMFRCKTCVSLVSLSLCHARNDRSRHDWGRHRRLFIIRCCGVCMAVPFRKAKVHKMRAAVVPSAWWKPRWNSTKFVGGSDLQSWRKSHRKAGRVLDPLIFFCWYPLSTLSGPRLILLCSRSMSVFTFHADTCQMLTYADIWWPHQIFSRATPTV